MTRTGRPRSVRTAVLLVVLGVLFASTGTAALARTSDPYRAEQYALEMIGIPAAWRVTQGDGVVVAIVDSGVDLDHPDLVGRFLRDGAGAIVGRDFVDDDDLPDDEFGHGTMVAGIVAAEHANGLGIAGAAPQSWLMPVRVLDEEGTGSGGDVDAGIRWAVDHGADVINLSLEGALPLPGTSVVSQAPDAAVAYAWERGVVVVAAAGNSGNPFTDYPASSPVLIVGSTDRDGEPSSFSDSGARDSVVAPGEEIVSTWCHPCGSSGRSTYGTSSGTSFAAPHAAAGIALLLADGRSPAQALDRLRTTAEDVGSPGRDSRSGYGLIHLGRALEAVSAAGSPPQPSSASPRPQQSPSSQSSTAEATASAAPPVASPSGATTPDGSVGPAVPDPSVEPAPSPSPVAQDAAAPDGPTRARPLRVFAAMLLAFTVVALLAERRQATTAGRIRG